MSKKTELARQCFKSGLNCAQSVIYPFCEQYGLDPETAMRLSAGFGGGFRAGEICGAASGAVAVIGLKYGQSSGDDALKKADCEKKAAEFMKAFRENGAVTCKGLLTPKRLELSEKGLKDNLRETFCTELVAKTAELLESMGY